MVDVALGCRDVASGRVLTAAVAGLDRSAQLAGERPLLGHAEHGGRTVEQDGLDHRVIEPVRKIAGCDNRATSELAQVPNGFVADVRDEQRLRTAAVGRCGGGTGSHLDQGRGPALGAASLCNRSLVGEIQQVFETVEFVEEHLATHRVEYTADHHGAVERGRRMQLRAGTTVCIALLGVVTGTICVGTAAPVVDRTHGVVPDHRPARRHQHCLVTRKQFPAVGTVRSGKQIDVIRGQRTAGDRCRRQRHLPQATRPAQHLARRALRHPRLHGKTRRSGQRTVQPPHT